VYSAWLVCWKAFGFQALQYWGVCGVRTVVQCIVDNRDQEKFVIVPSPFTLEIHVTTKIRESSSWRSGNHPGKHQALTFPSYCIQGPWAEPLRHVPPPHAAPPVVRGRQWCATLRPCHPGGSRDPATLSTWVGRATHIDVSIVSQSIGARTIWILNRPPRTM